MASIHAAAAAHGAFHFARQSLRKPKRLEAQKNLKKPSTGSTEYLQYTLKDATPSGYGGN